MSLFEGGESLMRMAWESASTPGVTPWNASWHDHRFNSETMSDDQPLIQPNSLSGGRQRTPGEPSKITLAGTVPVDWEPEGLGYYIAAFQKKAGSVTTLTGGQSYRHKLAPSETSVDFDKTFSVRISRNNKMPQLSPGCLVGSLGFVVGVQSVVTGAIGITAQRSSFYDMATVVAETSTPTRPILRGIPKYAVASAADPDVYIEVSNVSGIVKVKVGSGGTLTANQTLTAGAWTTLLYNNGSADVPIGDTDNPVQAYLPNFTNWTAGGSPDTWRFKFDHTSLAEPWTPTFPDIKLLNEIHATIALDGSATPTDVTSLTLNTALTLDPNFAVGGRYSKGVLEKGLRSYTGQLERNQIDNALLKRLLNKQRFKLDLTISSRVLIGSSSDPYRARIVAPHCIFNGKAPNVSGPDVLVEALPFDCYPDPDMLDGTHVDEWTVYLDNGVSDMTT